MSTLITIIFCAVYFGITVFLCRGLSVKTRDLCMCGIVIALTLVLESIRIPLPTGATIPFASMLPLMFLAVYNYKLAFLGGWVAAIMALILIPGWQPVHWGQIFVEHLVCFSCIGYTGIFGVKTKWRLLLGIVLASVLKLCGHTLSGVLFFSQNAWDGWGAWGYSLGYNISQNVPLAILCGAVFLSIPLKTIHQITKVRTEYGKNN